MHCHCGTNKRAPRWIFTDPCKPEVRPGAREESASLAWLAAPAMNARDTTKGIYGGLTMDVDQHYRGSVTATTHQEKDSLFFVVPAKQSANQEALCPSSVCPSLFPPVPPSLPPYVCQSFMFSLAGATCSGEHLFESWDKAIHFKILYRQNLRIFL